ncbi:MAG: stealth family protein [Bacteroidales bacterium]|nr:stealth family protein [Bacteroidales bacterium]
MTDGYKAHISEPVDAVILWVDGSDPLLAEKRNKYLSETSLVNHRGALSTFYASNNEIRYCLFSILKFAPFVRNVFIVTDGQDPNLYEDVKNHFPTKSGSLKVVDHKEIFSGYEQYLPTFNSTSLLSMMWRIKGLSDNFLFFNDDMFIIRETRPEDWFRNGRPVLRGKWLIPPYKKMLSNYFKILINRYLRNNPDYQPRLSFYLRQWNAASLLGMKVRYFFHCHTPHPLSRVRLQNYFADKSWLLERNIAPRFRSPEQFLMTSLAYHLEILDGNRQTEKLGLGYLHPYYSKKRMERRMHRCETDGEMKFICAQSLDMFSTEERERIFAWMDKILGIEVPR